MNTDTWICIAYRVLNDERTEVLDANIAIWPESKLEDADVAIGLLRAAPNVDVKAFVNDFPSSMTGDEVLEQFRQDVLDSIRHESAGNVSLKPLVTE